MSGTSITDHGIILRTRPLTETSLIVQWLTLEHGRLSTVARGARQNSSPFRGKLDLFYRARFSFVRSRRSDLHTLNEVILEETYSSLREDLGRLHQAGYAAALIEQTTETDTPLPALYQLFLDFIGAIQRRKPRVLEVFALEIKLLDQMGLNPVGQAASISAGSLEIMRRLGDLSFEKLSTLHASEKQAYELGNYLHWFLDFHMGKLARGRNKALGVDRGKQTL